MISSLQQTKNFVMILSLKKELMEEFIFKLLLTSIMQNYWTCRENTLLKGSICRRECLTKFENLNVNIKI